MRFGLYLPNFGTFGDARLLADLAYDAESAGWDGFFIWDHIAAAGLPHVDPWVALTAIALRTSRIRIGTTVTPLPRRRPWKVARETVSIDRLSAGRLTLGVGIGLGKSEWDDLGEETDNRTRGEMLDESLEILVGLWSGKRFNFTGEHYTVNKARFLPTPLQQPRIPIWVGAQWPNKRPLRRAVHWDGVFPLFSADTVKEELARLAEIVAYCHHHGSPGQGWDVVCMGVTPEDRAEATAMVKQWADKGATWWLESITPYRWGKRFGDSLPLDPVSEVIQGGPPARP